MLVLNSVRLFESISVFFNMGTGTHATFIQSEVEACSGLRELDFEITFVIHIGISQ